MAKIKKLTVEYDDNTQDSFVSVTTCLPPLPPLPPTTHKTDVWTYIGETTIDTIKSYLSAHPVHAVKCQWGELTQNGGVVWWGEQFSVRRATMMAMQERSVEQYITVVTFSANSIMFLVSDAAKRSEFSNAVIKELDFLSQVKKVTGFELDLEDFGSWTQATMAGVVQLVKEMSAALHAKGYKLHIATPAKSTDNGYPQNFSYPALAATTVDKVAVMTYDGMYSINADTAPNAPLPWVESCVKYAVSKLGVDRVIGGIPSYGYHDTAGQNVSTPTTISNVPLSSLPGNEKALRDVSSGELHWLALGQSYWYMDEAAMKAKLEAIKKTGVKHASIWSLKGNLFV